MKNMHAYAIFDHDREKIGRLLGVVSWIIPPILAGLFADIQSLSGWSWVGAVSITSGALYTFFHWLFKVKIWRMKLLKSILNIPDFNGDWAVTGQTLDEQGKTHFSWSGKCKIEQNWKEIIIYLSTDSSESWSYTANLFKKYGPKGSWQLSYSYSNEPFLEKSHELNSHKGYCEINFNDLITEGKASYFNSNGRKTFGNIQLKKVPY